MKNIFYLLLIGLCLSATASNAQNCVTPKLAVSSFVPVEPSGGFCIDVTSGLTTSNTYPTIWEFWYHNTDTCADCWHKEYNLGATIGSSGFGKGTVCYSWTWDSLGIYNMRNGVPAPYYISLHGIKSGAQVKFRAINYKTAEYANYPVEYELVKNDATKWCGFSNTITVTFAASDGKGGKGKGSGKPPKN